LFVVFNDTGFERVAVHEGLEVIFRIDQFMGRVNISLRRVGAGEYKSFRAFILSALSKYLGSPDSVDSIVGQICWVLVPLLVHFIKEEEGQVLGC
jgi:hypothetical protein